jgi:hypothetical protein
MLRKLCLLEFNAGADYLEKDQEGQTQKQRQTIKLLSSKAG